MSNPESIPPPVPENGSRNEPTAKQATNESNKQPEKENELRLGGGSEDSKMTTFNWGEAIGGLIVLPWLWSSMVASHEFKEVLLLAVGVCVGYVACCHLIYKFFRCFTFVLSIWVLASSFTGYYVYGISKPEAEIQFHLILNTSESPHINMPLTNKFLFPKGGLPIEGTNIRGLLVLPLSPPGFTNALFKLALQNDDTNRVIEGAQVVIRISPDLDFVGGATSVAVDMLSTIKQENEMKALGLLQSSPIYANQGQYLADVDFRPSSNFISARLPATVAVHVLTNGVIRNPCF